MNLTRRTLLGTGLASALPMPHALAQEGKDLRIIVPTGAGGALDSMARLLGEQLGTALKQNVVIDNRGGAAGQLAAGPVAKAVGDPNTLLLGSLGIIAMSPHLYGSSMPYDVRRDFTPVVLCARSPSVLVVNPGAVPVNNMAEFTGWAKAQKHPIPYGTFGSGSVAHVAAVLLSSAASVPMVQVPYRDPARILGDLLKGDLPLIFDAPTAYAGFAKEDKLRILAITTKTRSPVFPNLPTMDESGYPGFDLANWFGFFMPANVPPAAVERLRAATRVITETPRFKEQLLPIGVDPTGAAAVNFPAMVDSEIQRWGEFVRKNDIKLTS